MLQTISIYDSLVGLLSGVIYLDNHPKEKEELQTILQDEFKIDLSSDEDRKACLALTMALKLLCESAEIEDVDISKNLLEPLLDSVLKDVTKVLELDKELTPEDSEKAIKEL